jgi:hypothetical protein
MPSRYEEFETVLNKKLNLRFEPVLLDGTQKNRLDYFTAPSYRTACLRDRRDEGL